MGQGYDWTVHQANQNFKSSRLKKPDLDGVKRATPKTPEKRLAGRPFDLLGEAWYFRSTRSK